MLGIEDSDEAWIMVYECPWKRVTPFTRWCASKYGHYKNGFLLRAGGVDDQPALYLDAMNIMDCEYNKIQNEMAEERAKN